MPIVHLTPSARHDFNRVPPRYQPALFEALEAMSAQRLPGDELRGAMSEKRRVRRGDFRIVYWVDQSGEYWVERIRHRSRSYRRD